MLYYYINMSLNNKFGECCNCPARMEYVSDDFVDYTTPSIREMNERAKVGAMSVHEYNDYLETQGDKIVGKRMQFLKDNYNCKNNGDNLFFVDSNGYHDKFTAMQNSIPEQSVVPSDKQLSNYMPTEEKSNFTLRTVTSSKAVLKCKSLN